MVDGRPQAMTGSRIELESGDGAFAAYLAIPAVGHGPGVVVLHEAWGLVPQIHAVCDRLARSGFVALAPDLYRGETARDPEAASRLMAALDLERLGRDLIATGAALRRRSETTGHGLGCIGFCMGGKLALWTACLDPDVTAVVDCYGVHPSVPLDLDRCRARVLGIFAENDEYVSSEAVRSLDDALRAAGVEAQLRTYVGVRHAFLNDARPDLYDADSAVRAWRDIETFLAAELR